jgi:hypothetical protein
VLLHVATDLMAGIVAVITIVVVQRLTRLLSPGKLASSRRMVVVRVPGAAGRRDRPPPRTAVAGRVGSGRDSVRP